MRRNYSISTCPKAPRGRTSGTRARRRRNRDRWNYHEGFSRELSRDWSLQAEIGFGGSRDNAMVSGAYRW